jgi:hypothetical protein
VDLEAGVAEEAVVAVVDVGVKRRAALRLVLAWYAAVRTLISSYSNEWQAVALGAYVC